MDILINKNVLFTYVKLLKFLEALKQVAVLTYCQVAFRKRESENVSCLVLSNSSWPMDCVLPGSSAHGAP